MVCDLVTQVFAPQTKPNIAFWTTVAKALVKKYPLLNDKGKNVAGYGKSIPMHIHWDGGYDKT